MPEIDTSFMRKYAVAQLARLMPDDLFLLLKLVKLDAKAEIVLAAKSRSGTVAETILKNSDATQIEILKALEPWMDKTINIHTED